MWDLFVTFGGPAIVISILAYVLKRLFAEDKGIQALLRDRLYQLYFYCLNKGCCSIHERENFDNMYQQYHNLGVNGVMDDIYKKFMEIPIEKEK